MAYDRNEFSLTLPCQANGVNRIRRCEESDAGISTRTPELTRRLHYRGQEICSTASEVRLYNNGPN